MTTEPGVSVADDMDDERGTGRDEEIADHLHVLGLPSDAGWDEICDAHRRLVSDLTPGPEATHRNVALANQLLSEVNSAFDSLRAIASVA